MKNLWIAAFLAAAVACDNGKPTLAPPTSDLGTGLNTVEHRYAKPIADVLKAAATAVQTLGLHSDSQKSDALGGEIIARRATEDKVVISIKGVDASNTSVSVRVGPGNRNMANLVHEQIAVGLGLQEASMPRESLAGHYAADLKSCTGAAEKAFRVLKYEIVDRKTFDGGLELHGRSEDAVPASFRLEKESPERTAVTISCGTANGASHRERCERLKAEFEKAIDGFRSP